MEERNRMKTLNLIKQLNESLGEKDPVKQAMEELDLELTNDEDDFEKGQESELYKLAYQLKDQIVGMNEFEARERVATELEALEYSPDEIEQFLPAVMDKINEITELTSTRP